MATKIARGTTGQATFIEKSHTLGQTETWFIYRGQENFASKNQPNGWNLTQSGVLTAPVDTSVSGEVDARFIDNYLGFPNYDGRDSDTYAYKADISCMTADVDFIQAAGSINYRAILTAYVSVSGGAAPRSIAWNYPPGAVDSSGQPFTAQPQFAGNGGTVSVEFYHDFPAPGASETLTLGVTVTDSDSPACSVAETREIGLGRGECPDGQHDDGTGMCVADPIDPTTPKQCAAGYHLINGVCVIDETTDGNGCCLPGYYQKVAGGPCLPIPQFPLDFMFALTFTPTGAKVEVRPFNVSLNSIGAVNVQWIRDGVEQTSRGMSIEFPLPNGSQSEVHCTLSDGTTVVARELIVARDINS